MQTTDSSSPRVPRLRAWLSTRDTPCSADLIFVLAGRMHRKVYGLELFRQELAQRILFSVGRFEIRRFSKMALPVSLDLLKIAQEVPPPQRHYFVCFQGQEVRVEHVLPGRFGTLTEIAALARWLEANPEVRSINVISSANHLRRIRMCCRSLLKGNPKLAFLAAPLNMTQAPLPVATDAPDEHTLSEEGALTPTLKGDLWELFKLAIYWVLLKFR